MPSVASSTLSPLPEVLSKGLVAVATSGMVSFLCSASLFLYLTYRLIYWRFTSDAQYTPNQFLVLIYNLLLADIQQALAFMLNVVALRNNAVVVGTSSCWAQGWFVSTGDLASSVFILAIALHTFFGVVKEYRLPSTAFYACIAGNWFFIYFMGAIGPLVHGKDFYVRASAWCWINEKYGLERLWLHYFWIFVAMFTTIVIYSLIYIYLFKQKRSPRSISPKIIAGTSATPLMILYPLIYTICTAPLAAGRIVALAGHKVSLTYFCIAGTMIAANGFLDVLLYAGTRSEIVFSEHPPSAETGLETFAFMGKGHRLGTTTVIQANGLGERTTATGRMKRNRNSARASTSEENLYGLHQIGVKGEVTVEVHALRHGMVGQDRLARDASTWDERSGKSTHSFEA